MSKSYLFLAAALALVLPVAGCGSEDGAECGNGVVEGGEQCDDGNLNNNDGCTNGCRMPLGDTLDAVIKWEFNKDAAPGFTGDSCFDLGVSRVEVTITGPETFMAEESCSFRQVTFTDIPAGTYTASLRPVNVDGELLTTGPYEEEFTIGGADLEVVAIVPHDLWTRAYTGTFFFRLRWQGDDCGDALPPVVDHWLLLEQGGSPVSKVTEGGDPLDGSDVGDCRSVDEQFPQSALEVPFGPAKFTVRGMDSGGDTQFEETFDTFVGAGVSNPTIEFDVDSLNPPMADAGPVDGG